jgi:anti-sigma regulatory factor (Ser/Thr protein kinase)
MALVELTLTPLPAHVRTARLVGVAAARRAGLEPELVDELRLAVGEACSRAVGLHARHAQGQPVRITVSDDPAGLTITVTDQGPAAGPASDDPAGDLLGSEAVDEDVVDPDVALAVLSGLVDDYSVEAGPGGTTVTLRWPLPPGPTGTAGAASTQAAAE